MLNGFVTPLFFCRKNRKYITKKSDRVETVITKVPAPCPSVVRFADSLNVGIERIFLWRDVENDFHQAYEQAMHFQCAKTNYEFCPLYPAAGPDVAKELEQADYNNFPRFWEWLGRIDKLRQELDLCK